MDRCREGDGAPEKMSECERLLPSLHLVPLIWRPLIPPNTRQTPHASALAQSPALTLQMCVRARARTPHTHTHTHTHTLSPLWLCVLIQLPLLVCFQLCVCVCVCVCAVDAAAVCGSGLLPAPSGLCTHVRAVHARQGHAHTSGPCTHISAPSGPCTHISGGRCSSKEGGGKNKKETFCRANENYNFLQLLVVKPKS